MPRQSIIRVKLTASKKLRTKEGLAALAELPSVEIEESSAKDTSR